MNSQRSVKVIATTDDAKALLEQVSKQGNMSVAVKEIVVDNLDNFDEMAVGPDAEKLGATAVTIIVLVVDKSGSMRDVEGAVREGLNEIVEALKESKGAEEIVITLVVFSDNVEIPFDDTGKLKLANRPIGAFPKVGSTQYTSSGSTALYDAIELGLSTAMNYQEQLLAQGTTVTVQVIAMSDGADNNSAKGAKGRVVTMTDEINGKRPEYTLAFVGFQTFEPVDYKKIAREVGFNELLEVDATDPDVYKRRHAIRQALKRVSRSSVNRSKATVDPTAGSGSFFAP